MVCEACGINRRVPKQTISRKDIGDMALCVKCYNQARLTRALRVTSKFQITVEDINDIKEFMKENRELWRKM
jgi:hypothetical protein